MGQEPERRRAPRVAAIPGDELAVPVSATVRLLDLSMTGAMLASAQAWSVGKETELRALLNGEPFVARVDLRRSAPAGDGGDAPGLARLGVAFVSLDDRSRSCIRRFLKEKLG